jgi:helix-turn-helix protein/uncharacterized protein DUF4115
METRIGEVFREARRRREIDLAEVEQATRIRPRFLRAIEAEEWDVLPGGVYTRGFIRAYAAFLGLDGDRLAEDYRETVEGASREWTSPEAEHPASPPFRARRRLASGCLPGRAWLVGAGVVGIAALAIVVLPGGGSVTRNGAGKRPNSSSATTGDAANRRLGRRNHPGLSMRLAASAEVWVCVLDGRGRRLVDGRILEEGAEAGPFRSGSFTVSFGNGAVSMTIDGKEAEIPPTSSPIGYAVDASGKLVELSESERPTCT